MRVLVSYAAEQLAGREPLVNDAAHRLAGPAGEVVYLSHLGVRGLNRRLSPAETQALRRCLAGRHRGATVGPRLPDEAVVGYVCVGRLVGSAALEGSTCALVAVQDHADLTFRSPLRGPNAGELGPRFPVMAGLHRPDLVTAAVSEARPGLVAEVANPSRLSSFEAGVISGLPFAAATDQLATVGVLAAHLGYKLSAFVATTSRRERLRG